MKHLYPQIEPYNCGMLPVSATDAVYWESCGNPRGKAALVLHGGPGSGCTSWHRRLFDPEKYRIVLFDQRGCGRSRPHAGAPTTKLTQNTTANLLDDIERLRLHLRISRWLLLGGSWGSALALSFAEQFPASVSELILFALTTGTRREFDWLFREGLEAFFPEAWEQRLLALPESEQGADIVSAYCRLLDDPDPTVRQKAALSWCLWESATAGWPPSCELSARFRDPDYAMAYARLVTHYVSHDGWLGDGKLLRDIASVAHLPAILINGRFDFQAPIGNAMRLHRLLPKSQLVIVENAGHRPEAAITEALIEATEHFSIRLP
jgi:proline iminopeptidase